MRLGPLLRSSKDVLSYTRRLIPRLYVWSLIRIRMVVTLVWACITTGARDRRG